MKLLILDGPRSPRFTSHSHYRGTYRAHPTYCEALPEKHEINRLFFWFLEEGGESGVVRDLSKACRYAELLNEHLTAFNPAFTQFEVVEVCDRGESSHAQDQLLGFDLSSGYNNSLLWWGLKTEAEGSQSVPRPRESLVGVGALPKPIQELYKLIHRCYAPELNANGLFQNPEVALQCLRSMDALQQLSPNLYEGTSLEANYGVVGIYLAHS